jgi:glycosyltransferase involved in cell wall biosynthesis
MIHAVEKYIFLSSSKEQVDILHFINMMDSKIPEQPYIVDLEHAASLISFTRDEKRLKKATEFLINPNCRSINCMSEAALKSLKNLTKDKFKLISDKTTVIYPAVSELDLNDEPDSFCLGDNKESIRLLFVGNQAYLKGLEELILALKNINNKFSEKAIQLYVISDDANSIIEKYKLPNVTVFKPEFSKKQIFTQFFMTCDIFVMPTKEDTFGMAILDALVCGTPVITTDQFALAELVTDKVDGILLNLPRPVLDSTIVPSREDMASINRSNVEISLLDQMTEIFENILNNQLNINDMKNKGKIKFKNDGIFSIERRNKKLKEVYERALSSV